MMSDLLSYWPAEENIAACMKIDAESASEAVFLAVHQPVTFERYEIGSQSSSAVRCGEQELLDAFLKPNLSDGRVIIPLVGDSGTGKSHVVRWINSKLQQMPDAHRRVIIRIPKGTSLKGVLGLLLEKLDDPEYEPFREKLRKAQDELDGDEAAGLLCEMLAYTLSENAQAARSIRLTNPSDREAKAVQAYGDPTIMPTLLRNQRLRDLHFIKDASLDAGPIRRLVEQLTIGRDSSGEDDRKHQFVPEDLLFIGLPLDELGSAERNALNFIDRADRRVECVRVLNKALVDAKERLLGIDPTVTELFDAVRRKLLEQDKELLLLVEDFAVLSGIQKQLLQVVIKEAIRDGQQILCTMRSVLAYTSGYMDTATVLTRAGAEYRIVDEEGDDTEILNRIERLVGAYLNAARIGQSDLDSAYKDFLNRVDVSRMAWLPDFTPDISSDSRKLIESFSQTMDGYSLFPFNRSAIRELSYEGSVRAEKLIFNPRHVIQNVLNRVLLNRGSFSANQFPSAEFTNQNRLLSARVSRAIQTRVNPDDFDKWVRFLRYWGGNPASPEMIAFSPRSALAFGLDPTALSSLHDNQEKNSEAPVAIAPPVKQASRSVTQATGALPLPLSTQNLLETEWEKHLESWRNGQRMGQNEAKELRKLLWRAVSKMINWDWDLIKPLENAFGPIYIPLAPGNDQYSEDSKDIMFAVCREEDLTNTTVSTTLISALMAVIRFHLVYSESWDYVGADADLPLYSGYMEPLVQAARKFVTARYFRTPSPFDPCSALLHGLLTGGRVLGICETARDRDYPSLLNSLFGMSSGKEDRFLPNSLSNTDSTGWESFASKLSIIRRGGKDPDSWITHLLNLVGARQGGAPLVHAIDAARLKGALDSTVRSWDFNAQIPDVASKECKQFRQTYTELKKASASIEKESDACIAWHTSMTAWLGENIDKELLVAQLRDTVESAKIAGLASGLEPAQLLKTIEDFRGVRFKAAYEDVARLKESATRGLTLSVLGAGHKDAINFSSALESKISFFLEEVEIRLNARSQAAGSNPKQDALDALKFELGNLEAPLKEVCAV